MEWRKVPGYDQYEVSNTGLVRRGGRELKPGLSSGKYYTVALSRSGVVKSFRLHTLVALAFFGPCPPGMEVRHLDDDPRNNDLANLVYGTRSENRVDRVRNGLDHEARKTHCPQGHEYTPDNIYGKTGQVSRQCKICTKERAKLFKQNAKLRKGLGTPPTQD